MDDLQTKMAALLEGANTSGVTDALLDEFAELKQQLAASQQSAAQAESEKLTRAQLATMTASEKIGAGLKLSRPGHSTQNQRRK